MTPDPPSIPEDLAAQLADHVDSAVRTYCRLLPAHDRQDLAQDALAALVDRWRAGRPDDPYSWLVAVIRKLYAMRRRTRRRDKAKASFPWLEFSDDGTTGAHEPTCRSDPWAELDQILDAVTPPYSVQAKAMVREFAAGKTRGEIAEELCESVDIVKVRLKKTLERLRFFMGRGKSTGGGG